MSELAWQGAAPPTAQVLSGRWVRLEPIADEHADGLFAASAAPRADDRFRYLPDPPPGTVDEVRTWIDREAANPDVVTVAVVDAATGVALGRQSLMRIDAEHGVMEIGNILWGPGLAGTRGATEALFLAADHVFALGYRRFEWKCDDENTPSKRAAVRFGFTPEGVFRQHRVVKGRNRDTAWFSMLDGEWPSLRAAYLAWLDPANFDGDGRQRTRLMTR